MKIDRYRPQTSPTGVKLLRDVGCLLLALATIDVLAEDPLRRQQDAASPQTQATNQLSKPATGVSRADTQLQVAPPTRDENPQDSQPQAVGLLRQVLEMIVHGPAFDAKVRQTVWTAGREVVGVGTYEQAGGGSGRFNLQLTMHDGDGKHRLQQISDGRLAWTRTEIAGKVSLRRVDVGRLDQWVSGTTRDMRVSPGQRVGAWAEMLTTIESDYTLRVDTARLKDEAVWVITGVLRDEHRKKILAESGRTEWPILCPTRVRVAVKSTTDETTGLGRLMPIRLEYWSDPVRSAGKVDAPDAVGRLIALIEIYSIRPISPPPAQRFRFENQDAEVNFTNETDLYIQRYGVRLTDRQRRQLRR